MRRLFSAFLFCAMLAVAAAVAGFFWIEDKLSAPGPSGEQRIFVVEPGEGVSSIAAKLAREGLIEDALLFRLGARIARRDRDLKAGEFEIPAGASMLDVLELLESGRSIAYRVTAPEGATSWEVARILEDHPALTGALEATPPEGSLLPETYFFERGASRAEVIERMREAMEREAGRLWAERAPGLPLNSLDEAIVLASIVEKETALAEEYGVVASVFYNRIERGMRLQTDPTVIYGITEGKGALGRRLLRSDLKTDHPYNTYTRDGLPPGPIANPGLGALEAVLDPPETDYYYFVADGRGGHVFAKTLDEHNRNVVEWRRIRSERERVERNRPPDPPPRRPAG